jgi:hypothetical protein
MSKRTISSETTNFQERAKTGVVDPGQGPLCWAGGAVDGGNSLRGAGPAGRSDAQDCTANRSGDRGTACD